MTLARRTRIILGAVFAFFAMPAAAYLAQRSSCLREPESWLVIENRMSTDVTIVNEELNKNSEQIHQETLGTVPAGQTENMTMVVPIPESRLYTYDKRTLINTFQLKAEDSAGSVVWQKSWPWREFLKLNRAEGFIRIVISPETDAE